MTIQHSKMATKKSGFAYLLLFLTISTASCTLSDIFDEVASCKEVCRNTYTPHTYEKVDLSVVFRLETLVW